MQMKDTIVAEGKYANGVTYSVPAVDGDDAVHFISKLTGVTMKDILTVCWIDTVCAVNNLKSEYDSGDKGVRAR